MGAVTPEFYIILKIVKIDTGSPKIFKYPHWIFKDCSRLLKTCTESFEIFKYL